MKIVFDGFYGNQVKKVELTQPFGVGGQHWHIYIDKYYKGSMIKRRNGWFCTSKKFETADISAIIERIEEYLENNNAR